MPVWLGGSGHHSPHIATDEPLITQGSPAPACTTGCHRVARLLPLVTGRLRAFWLWPMFSCRLSLLRTLSKHHAHHSIGCLCRPEGSVQATHHVLNECLIDRGSSPSMVRTELFVDGHHITTVQARAQPCQCPHMGSCGSFCVTWMFRTACTPASPKQSPSLRLHQGLS